MPVLFIGHGSPMNALQKNDFTRTLAEWGRRLPKPEAVLSISAHWYVQGTLVLSHPKPETIHDFFGFPKELYAVSYPAPGHPGLARQTGELLKPNRAELTSAWGLDHGTWSVLLHLFPKADVPVFQLSLDRSRSPREHYNIAKNLKPLRDRNVLILGSGNIVHNLGKLISNRNAAPYPWAVQFDKEVKTALEKGERERLIDYAVSFSKTAPHAVPTPEHYLPFLYALAATDENEAMKFSFEGFEHGSISLRSIQWA